MALTGLDIFKLLPKTNCKDCGVPTCLAFAMKLAQKKANLDECPHASEQAKSVLGAASEPPMRLLTFGVGPESFEVGGETEMYRHEKTFHHQTALAVRILDTEETGAISTVVSESDRYVVDRAGEKLHLNAYCLSNVSLNESRYLGALQALCSGSSKTVILDTPDMSTARKALEVLNGKRPVLSPRGADETAFVELAKEHGAGLVVRASSFEEMAAKIEKIVHAGFKDLLLAIDSSGPGDRLRKNTIMRRAALRKGFRTFGFPLATFLESGEEADILAAGVVDLCKYAGLLVLPHFSRETMLTLLALRQNIYTDPQKPIQVDAKLYAVGEPHADSPVFVTTNFSLTYFIVSSEIENAGVSGWLVVPDCEGMSVLTAWAAGKFSGAKIGAFVKEIKLEEHVKTREIIIPGYASPISGELEEVLPGWVITVGPQEASDIASFAAARLRR